MRLNRIICIACAVALFTASIMASCSVSISDSKSSNIVSSRAQERSKLITPPLDNEDESSIETLDEEIIGIGDGYLDNGMSEELELSGNEGEDED